MFFYQYSNLYKLNVFTFHDDDGVGREAGEVSVFAYGDVLVGYGVGDGGVFLDATVLHNNTILNDRAALDFDVTEEYAVFYSAVYLTTVCDEGVFDVGVVEISGGDAVFDLGINGIGVLEELVALFQIEESHTLVVVALDVVDDSGVTVLLIRIGSAFGDQSEEDIFLEVDQTSGVGGFYHIDKEVFLDDIDIHGDFSVFFTRALGDESVDDFSVGVGLYDNSSGRTGVCAVGDYRHVAALFYVVLTDVLKIYRSGVIAIADQHVFFSGLLQKVDDRIDSFYCALINFSRRIDDEGRENRYAAVLSIKVPVTTLSDMVGQRGVIVFGYNSYIGYAAVDAITEREIH